MEERAVELSSESSEKRDFYMQGAGPGSGKSLEGSVEGKTLHQESSLSKPGD